MAEFSASVVVLFDRGSFEPCLSSLLGQDRNDFEIIAVTGAPVPPPPAAADLGERFLMLAEPDRNPALRRNRAAARARASVIAFIDDDAEAPPDWLSRGLAILGAEPGLAGVGGPNLMPPGAGPRERMTDALLTAPLVGAGSRAYQGGGEAAEARPGELHLVNLFVRREALLDAGGFNEALGYGAEDTEFIHRARGRGHRFRFDPALAVRHRRRPFGIDYIRQRFRLRMQTGRLFAAWPEIYAGLAGFWLALLAPVAAVLLLMLTAAAGGLVLGAAALAAAVYAGFGVWLGLRAGLPAVYVALMPGALFIHHLIYAAGLWAGIASGVLSAASKIRERKLREQKSP